MKTLLLLFPLVACASPPRAPATPSLQSIADEELKAVIASARGGAIVIVDPSTGAVLADAHANLEPAYVTGSTLKGIVLAGALDDGSVQPDESFDLEQGAYSYAGYTMEDPSKNGVVTVPEMLQISSNVGFTKVFDRMGGARLEHWLRAFHFDPPTPIQDHTFAGAVVAIGEKMPASPVAVARAYATIASGGQGIIKPETAKTMTTMLESVVYGDKGTGAKAKVEGVRVAGKTGTAEWKLPDGAAGTYASFVGFVPSTNPKYVILVGADRPKDEHASGGTIAAPVFSRVATRALAAK